MCTFEETCSWHHHLRDLLVHAQGFIKHFFHFNSKGCRRNNLRFLPAGEQLFAQIQIISDLKRCLEIISAACEGFDFRIDAVDDIRDIK